VEKRDRSTPDTHRIDELVKPLTLFKLVMGGCQPQHFEDGDDAFPADSPPRLGERAHQNSVIQKCGSLRSPFRCVTLRSTSISNRSSLVRGNGIRRMFNGRAACEVRACAMEVDLVEFACLVFANIMIQRSLRTGLHDQTRVRLREIDGVGEPFYCSLSDTMSSGTELWLH
jgi:hypothetical protein